MHSVVKLINYLIIRFAKNNLYVRSQCKCVCDISYLSIKSVVKFNGLIHYYRLLFFGFRASYIKKKKPFGAPLYYYQTIHYLSYFVKLVPSHAPTEKLTSQKDIYKNN